MTASQSTTYGYLLRDCVINLVAGEGDFITDLITGIFGFMAGTPTTGRQTLGGSAAHIPVPRPATRMIQASDAFPFGADSMSSAMTIYR